MPFTPTPTNSITAGADGGASADAIAALLAAPAGDELLLTIRDAMTRAQVIQGDIGRATGVSSTTISRLCRGQYGHDSQAVRQVLEYLAQVLRDKGLPGLRCRAGAAEGTARPTPPAAPVAGPLNGQARLPAAPAGSIALPPAPAAAATAVVNPGLTTATVTPARGASPPGAGGESRPAVPPRASGAPVIGLATARLPEAAPSLAAPWGGAYCTDGQRLMWGVLRAIAADRELGLVVSLSGTGKSFVLDRFAEHYPGTLVYRPLRGISQSGILEDLCRLFGVPYSGSNDTRRRRLLDGAAGRTLLLDEADLLVAGRYVAQAVDRLEIYRQLQERGCAVALVGLPALLHTVQRGGETYVFSRIGYARAPAPPSETELAAYWRAQVAGYPQAHARAGLVALAAAKHGYLRYLDKLARRTRDTDGDVGAAETLLFRGDQR